MTLSSCNVDLLDPNWVTSQESGPVEVIERALGGAARVVFPFAHRFLHLKHLDDQPPLKWSKNRRCADAAIIIEEGPELCLHVVELKSKLTTKTWLTVKQQLSGMIANATAMLAVTGGPQPKKIICHVSFTEDAVGTAATADPILLKLMVGAATPIGKTDDWASAKLELFGFRDIPLRKIPRDPATGDGEGDLSCATN